jgi:hypothetical protein
MQRLFRSSDPFVSWEYVLLISLLRSAVEVRLDLFFEKIYANSAELGANSAE